MRVSDEPRDAGTSRSAGMQVRSLSHILSIATELRDDAQGKV